MAKQLQRTYVFTPGASGVGTVQIPGFFDLSQLLIITNVTKNQIIYNFADLNFVGTSVSFNRNNTTAFPQALQNTDGVTTITLGVSTAGMASTDVLQIFCERQDGAVITRPWPMGTDAFERTRVSPPQSMIDADFEYGLQPTKWQQLSTARNYPGIYEIPGSDLSVSSIITDASGGSANLGIDSLITITTSIPHNLTTATAITLAGLDSTVPSYSQAQGSFIIDSVPNSTTINYYAKGKVGTTTGTVISTSYTVVRAGGFYTSSARTDTTYTVVSGGTAGVTATIQVSFAQNHGFVPGSSIISVVTSDNGTNYHTYAQGPFYVSSVTSLTSIQYQARGSTGSISGTILGSIYARSDSFYTHRAYDGGVELGSGGPSFGTAAVRQSKKYIRYQSGKAINFNTGLLLAPNYILRSTTSSGLTTGSTITCVTDLEDHQLQPGSTITLSGINTTGYTGTYVVSSVTDSRTFSFTATSTLSNTTAILGTPALVSLQNWYGSTVRAGTYDEQNGIFWQYDGIQIAVGLRVSTTDLGGVISCTVGSPVVTGTNTRWSSQLVAGDRVVIRGMSHQVTQVISDTSMTVTPGYRGATNVNGVRILKTLDKIIPQSQWNVDRCNGSNGVYNPSGYSLQVNKMQMAGIQWTWYGAGFIDWMLRGPDGNYITVHRIKNSNVNNEAYMRTGNMPVRYEVINEGAHSGLTNSITTSSTSMTVTDVTYFPNSGIVYVDNELISYNGVTTSTNTLNNLTRATTLNQFVSGLQRTFSAGTATSHNTSTGVILIGQNAAPNMSHWGSALIEDGGFDQDRGYIFNYSVSNVLLSTKKTTLFAIRLAPSVSNALAGDLGVRDLINRAQFLLQAIEISSGGGATANSAIVIEGVLNPSNYPTNTNNITWYTLNGNINNSPISSGQPSFSQVAPGSLISYNNTATVATNSTGTFGSNILYVASTSTIAIGDAPYSAGVPAIAGGSFVQSIGSNFVTLNNPLLATQTTATSVTFYRNSYALPGETIFSFISSPAERDVLDLSLLKEMTNTPIGGRNCYPNGPDCLFINAYITQGSPIYTNMVLRWGEAQA